MSLFRFTAQDMKSVFELIKAGKMAPNGDSDKHAKITFSANIDMSGIDWEPLPGNFDIDGNSNTLSNVNVKTARKAGLYGWAGNAKISNLTIENATINGAQAGVFAGSAEKTKLTNCSLKGVVKVNWIKVDPEDCNGVGALFGVVAGGNDTENVFDVNADETTIVINKENITYPAGITAEKTNLVGVKYNGSKYVLN